MTKKIFWVFILAALFLLPVVPVMAETPGGNISVDISIDKRMFDAKPENDILAKTTVTMPAGSTAWDLLDKICKEKKIAAVNEYGMVTIDNLPGKQMGTGQYDPWVFWNFMINGFSASSGAGDYVLNDGDYIRFSYNMNLPCINYGDTVYDLRLLLTEAKAVSEPSADLTLAIKNVEDKLNEIDNYVGDNSGLTDFLLVNLGSYWGDDTPSVQIDLNNLEKALLTALNKNIVLESFILNKNQEVVVLGTSNPLKINYYPRNATKQIVTWSAEENQNILTINENTGEITALSKGQTRVSAYNEETKQTRECLITVVAPAGNIDLAANIKLTSQWIEENFKNFQVDYQSSWDWDVLAMKRAGQSISPYYMESLKNYLLNDSSINTNIAGLAKSGLVLAANKYDLTAFAGKDLVDLIYNSSSANMHKSGLNGPVYALLLADAGKLDLSGKAWDRDKLIAAVLEYQQGSAFSLLKGTDAKLDVDSSALALTALAPYYKQNGREVVTTAIDSAKTWLSKVQLSSAGFKSYFDEECSESPAQVIIALSSLGIDLKGNPSAWDTPFIKANTNLLQNLDMYSHRDGGVKHILSDAKGNSFSSQQALMAYVSYDRLINKQTAFYDFSDIKADDNSLLKALIAEYDKLSPNDYTSQSWAACQTAKTAIDSTLLANSDGRQQEIDAAYLSLDKAMKNLIKNHAQTSGDIAISGSADNWQIALTGLANITMDANFTGKLFTDMSAINDTALGLLVKDGSSVELTIPQGVKITSNNKNMEVLTPMILTDKYLADLKGKIGKLLSGNDYVEKIVDVRHLGDSKERVNFSDYVSIKFIGQGAMSAAWVDTNGKVAVIPAYVSEDAGRSSKKDVFSVKIGNDLVVYTKHFTDFVVWEKDVFTSGGGDGAKDAYLTIDLRAIGKGTLLTKVPVAIKSNDDAYTVLERACKANNIEIVAKDPGTNQVYVQNIGGYKEFDYGSGSGWNFSLNGDYKGSGAGNYSIAAGDYLVWIYTTDLGHDIGSNVDDKEVTPVKVVGDLKITEAIAKAGQYLAGAGQLSEWDIFALALNSQDKAAHYDLINQYIKDNKGEFRKVTDYARLILAIESLEKDPSKFGDYNLLEKLYNHPNMTMQGVNGPAFALIALDSKEWKTPANALWDREKLITYILKQQRTEGCFTLSEGEGNNVDLTAMTIQALAPYQERGDVKKALNKALDYLSKQQKADGGYELYGANNCESLSQVIIAVSSLGIDPAKDSRFAKKDGNLLSKLWEFSLKDGSFCHNIGGKSDNMATSQAMLAMISYDRFLQKQPSIYQLSALSDLKSFADLHKAAPWAVNSIKLAAQKGLMKGYDNQFNPKAPLNRAELTATFLRLLKIESKAEQNPFSDIQKTDWYFNDVTTAYAKALVKGKTDKLFIPKDQVTREEMAVIIYRAFKLADAKDNGQGIADFAKVSPWAKKEVAAVFASGVLQGDGQNFNPKQVLTREMTATMLVRLLDYQNK